MRSPIITLTLTLALVPSAGCSDVYYPTAFEKVVVEVPVDLGYTACGIDADCSQGEICAELSGSGEIESVCVVAEGGLGLSTCESDADCNDGICVDIIGVDGSVCTDGMSNTGNINKTHLLTLNCGTVCEVTVVNHRGELVPAYGSEQVLLSYEFTGYLRFEVDAGTAVRLKISADEFGSHQSTIELEQGAPYMLALKMGEVAKKVYFSPGSDMVVDLQVIHYVAD